MKEIINSPKFLYTCAAVLLFALCVTSVDIFNSVTTEQIDFNEVSILETQYQIPIISTTSPETRDCSTNEWNGYFEDYRNNLVNRIKTIKLLRGCNQW